jgi:hypothetical protein
LEILERHNRIKKLLIEEERTARKIEETRKKAQLLSEIHAEAHQKRKLCQGISKRDNEVHSE